jgi:hypothetical protein
MKKDTNNYAAIFAGLSVSDEERFRVGKEIEKLGGLTFKVQKGEDGWTAQCDQVDGIMAGNGNPNPSAAEIESEIRQAILAAFEVEVEQGSVQSPFSFEYQVTAEM